MARMPGSRNNNNAALQNTTLQKIGLVALGACLMCSLEMMIASSSFGYTSSGQRLLRYQGEEFDGSNALKQQQPSVIPTTTTTANKKNSDNTGWGSVHIFRGPQTDLEKIGQSVGFSQVGQDTVVLKLLRQKQHGYFVDLAANHAVVLSNTYRLEAHHGWHGLCIEPNTRYQSLHLHRSNCTLVQAIVGANRMEKVSVVLPQDMSSGPGGGIVGDAFDNKKTPVGVDASNSAKGRQQIKPVDMYTVPLTEILDRFDAPTVIDYLSLDVEGAEFYVMKSFAFDRYRIRVLTIERPNQDLVDLLYDNGYVYLATFNKWGDETIFVLKSELPSLDLTALEALHKGPSKKMEVPNDTLTEKPKVIG